jgi:hypothetical protein
MKSEGMKKTPTQSGPTCGCGRGRADEDGRTPFNDSYTHILTTWKAIDSARFYEGVYRLVLLCPPERRGALLVLAVAWGIDVVDF